MTECGRLPGHEGDCVPFNHIIVKYSTTKPKRKVSYNQDAILCPACKKRIRLNNNGEPRVHISGKIGSERCMGNKTLTDEHIQALADEAEAGYDPFSQLQPRSGLFSDQQ